MPAPGYGQFGTPGYFSKDIPPDIVKQYAGTQNFQEAGGMYGNLLYGPYSRAFQTVAAQAADPSARAFQRQGVSGGGAFGIPGEGAAELGNLFSGQMQGNVAGQKAAQEQQGQAAKGMLDVAQNYANNIYGQQSAALALEEAKARAAAEQQGAFIDLGSMIASVVSGSPIPMELAGVLTNQSQGIGNPQTAQSFANLGTGVSNWWNQPSAAQQYYPTGGDFSTIDPNAADPGAGGYYSGTGIEGAYTSTGDSVGGGALYLPGMFGAAAGA